MSALRDARRRYLFLLFVGLFVVSGLFFGGAERAECSGVTCGQINCECGPQGYGCAYEEDWDDLVQATCDYNCNPE